jgi:hypothetical protein
MVRPRTGLARVETLASFPGGGDGRQISGRGINLFKALWRKIPGAAMARARPGLARAGTLASFPVGGHGRQISGRGINLFKFLRRDLQAA